MSFIFPIQFFCRHLINFTIISYLFLILYFMSESIVLGYWGIRGRGQVSRHLLCYTGAKFNQKKYISQDQWKGIGKDQNSLGLSFPNLPYLIQGDFKLTQSKAIQKYIISISQKKQLLGKTLADQAYIDNIIQILRESLTNMMKLVYSGEEQFQQKKQKVLNQISPKLDYIAKFAGEKQFIMGYLTWADFSLAQLSYYVQNIFPQKFSSSNFLSKIRKSIQNLAQVKSYYIREDCVKGPFIPPVGAVKF